jgi:hypothetical protein
MIWKVFVESTIDILGSTDLECRSLLLTSPTPDARRVSRRPEVYKILEEVAKIAKGGAGTREHWRCLSKLLKN